MNIELEEENQEEQSGIWCLVATVAPEAATADRGRRTHRPFEPGAKVYCFPPNLSGAYESVKVIGPDRRTGRSIVAIVTAADLIDWRAEMIRDRQIISQIAPPWDGSEISRDVARGVATWKSGGPWPTIELRQWNRTHAQTQTGPGSLLTRLRTAVTRVLGREGQ